MTGQTTTAAVAFLGEYLAALDADTEFRGDLEDQLRDAVRAVLEEHAATAAELADTQRRFDALVTSDKAKQGAADWMLNRLLDDKLIDKGTYASLCGLLRDQIDATRHLTHSEDWGPLTDRFRGAVKRAKDAEAEIERQRVEHAALVAGYDMRGHEIAELRRERDARQAELEQLRSECTAGQPPIVTELMSLTPEQAAARRCGWCSSSPTTAGLWCVCLAACGHRDCKWLPKDAAELHAPVRPTEGHDDA